MKAIIAVLARAFLILLILMHIVGCFDKSPNSGNLTAGYVTNNYAQGNVLVDTGQIVCIEYSDGHVTCTCHR